jgi:hypothetical protein
LISIHSVEDLGRLIGGVAGRDLDAGEARVFLIVRPDDEGWGDYTKKNVSPSTA